jgi:hypothetical protein
MILFIKNLISIILLTPLAALGQPDSLGHLKVVAKQESADKFLKIINEDMPPSFEVRANKKSENLFVISLHSTGRTSNLTQRQKLYVCIFNYLLKNKKGDYTIQLTDSNPKVLIANGRYSEIDIGDIEKFSAFDKDSTLNYSAQTILIHELIEQFHLQNVQGVKLRFVKSQHLQKAHDFASQKEANYFNIHMKKDDSLIYDEYIYVSFRSRVDNALKYYYIINHRFGNVTDVEKHSF